MTRYITETQNRFLKKSQEILPILLLFIIYLFFNYFHFCFLLRKLFSFTIFVYISINCDNLDHHNMIIALSNVKVLCMCKIFFTSVYKVLRYFDQNLIFTTRKIREVVLLIRFFNELITMQHIFLKMLHFVKIIRIRRRVDLTEAKNIVQRQICNDTYLKN